MLAHVHNVQVLGHRPRGQGTFRFQSLLYITCEFAWCVKLSNAYPVFCCGALGNTVCLLLRRLILLRESLAPAGAMFDHLCSWENYLHSGACYCGILLFGMYPSKVGHVEQALHLASSLVWLPALTTNTPRLSRQLVCLSLESLLHASGTIALTANMPANM